MSDAHAPVVTIASLYGSGGSEIGARVAEPLGVPFLDREIPQAAAEQAGLSEATLRCVDDGPRPSPSGWPAGSAASPR